MRYILSLLLVGLLCATSIFGGVRYHLDDFQTSPYTMDASVVGVDGHSYARTALSPDISFKGLELGVNLNEAFEDSPNLPDDIIDLKNKIESEYDTFKIEAAQKKGGSNYFLYFKELSPSNREKWKEVTQDLIDAGLLPSDSKIEGGTGEGYYAKVRLDNNSTEKIELFAVGSEISESSK